MSGLYSEALTQFTALFAQAAESDSELEHNGMTLATATHEGKPSARTVLLKNYDARGFVFYTHMGSQKGQQLQENPYAALLFLWRSLGEAGVQVRIEGAVELVESAEADEYFATRPRMSQLGAWASSQSQALTNRETLEQRIAQYEQQFSGQQVSRPKGWNGYRVIPDVMEFWFGTKFRLHDRWRYERNTQGVWSKQQLYP